jgi:small subunit ribosomal protein S21
MAGKSKVSIVVKGDINKALKIFKRAVLKAGYLNELRERKEYKKPTTVKREEKLKAIRKNKFNQQNAD